MELRELKAQAYDILYAIEIRQIEINELKEQLQQVNEQIQKLKETE
jgi:FtsZ-binding cell division protein ZapB